jgi:hypothetical protein
VGHDSAGAGNVSGPTNHADTTSLNVDVEASLAEYADRLLLSTGLTAQDAFLIASGRQKVLDQLAALARALQAGWRLELLEEDKRA